MGIPSLLIAGTHSGVGKTTISTGIMAALTARGLQVQGFKVGPDYIDPSYHTGATGRYSRNLDYWLQGDKLLDNFVRGCTGADIAIVEGVMGLFDGIKGNKELGSSAHIAALLNIPVILIVDVRSMAYSTAALVHGFANFDPRINLAGVILNRVGSLAHFTMVKEAVETQGIPVLGYIGREEKFVLPERHLGLVPLGETGYRQDYFRDLTKVIEDGLDMGRLISIAAKHSSEQVAGAAVQSWHAQNSESSTVQIAIARDEAFSFYYQDALDLLTDLGAQIMYFSPLHDKELPADTQGIIIGGGFPESFLAELEQNHSLRASLQAAHAQGIPIYAECGGLMYLCDSIQGFDGITYQGVGLVPGTCLMTKKLQGMGYRQGSLTIDTIIGGKNTPVRGHEFHYSKIEYTKPCNPYQLSTASGEERGTEGYASGNLLASYLHQNFAGNPDLAVNFLKACRAYQGIK